MSDTPVQPNPAALLHVMTPHLPTEAVSAAYRLGQANGALISARARTTGILAMIDNLRRVQYMSHDEVLTMIEESVTELREALSRDIQD